MYKKLLFALLLFGCTTKQIPNRASHIQEEGFYYKKYDNKNSNDTQLMRFYSNGDMVELAYGGTEEKLNDDSHFLACLLDTVLHKGAMQTPAFYNYQTKEDSVFFKKKNWDFDGFYYNLSFACKFYNDSMVARITPVDYDTTGTEPAMPAKSYIATFKFKQALCDTAFARKMSGLKGQW